MASKTRLYKISPVEFEELWLSEKAIGVVDTSAEHTEAVAEILSERYPGIVFLWQASNRNGVCEICAVRADRRKIPDSKEENIVSDAEDIAAEIAAQSPPKKLGLLSVFGSKPRLKAGWHYREAETKKVKKNKKK